MKSTFHMNFTFNIKHNLLYPGLLYTSDYLQISSAEIHKEKEIEGKNSTTQRNWKGFLESFAAGSWDQIPGLIHLSKAVALYY